MARQKKKATGGDRMEDAGAVQGGVEEIRMNPQEGMSESEGADALTDVLDRLDEEVPDSEGRDLSSIPPELRDATEAVAELEDGTQDSKSDDDSDGAEDDGEDAEDDAESWDPSDDDLDRLVTLKVQGEDVTIPLREALSGYQRQADYSRKTMELAEQRRAFQEDRTAVESLVGAYSDRLEALAVGMGRMLGPEQAVALTQEYANAKAQQRALQASALQDHLETEHDALCEAMGWESDDAVSDGYQALADGAVEAYGFTYDDLHGVTDHRLLVLLSDALETRQRRGELKNAKDKARKNRRKSKTLPPGTPDRSSTRGEKARAKQARAASDRLRESGSVHDATKAIAAILGPDA